MLFFGLSGVGLGLWCLNASFNNISVISWQSVYWWRKPEYPENTTVLSLTDFITGFVTKLTRRVPLVEQKLLTLPEHLSSPRFLWGSCYSTLALCVCFVDCCFFLLYFFCWPLFFFDLRILITLLVSSNSSFHIMLYRVHPPERGSNSKH